VSFLSQGAWATYDSQHGLFTQILAAHVKKGVVDYPGIKAQSGDLDRYLAQIGEVTRAQFDAFGREEQMAYLINAYNAFTLKLISDFYPVDSIRDIGGKVGGNIFNRRSKQWKVSEYEANGHKVEFRAMGQAITLDEIEHENLRPHYRDPRVHFALVCGAVSCPFLRSEAYVSSRLNQQLDDQGRTFLADPFRNRYEDKSGTLLLSQIFDWFGADFTRDGRTVFDFVKPYLPAEMLAKIKGVPNIGYLDYDWSLNAKAGHFDAGQNH
jgi:hypothetical protein